MQRWFRVGRGAALLVLVTWCSPAQAWIGEVSWPTFYRSGPGRNYTVLDELDRGATLDVLSCGDGWCQVQDGRSTGYVEQKWILQPSAMPQKPGVPSPEDCVESLVTGSGYKGGLQYRFCPRTQVSVPPGQPAPGSPSSGAH